MVTKNKINIVGVQYLRGIAALMVVGVHTANVLPSVEPWTAFGYTGVDIFFVISGFIMAHSTRSFDPSKALAQQCILFWRRRFIRVVPLYWIALIWTIKVPLVFGEFQLAWLQDFLFIPRAHFTGNIWPELVAGWTVNYEVFFYAIFGLAMLAGKLRYLVLSVTLLTLMMAGLILSPTSAIGFFYTSTIIAEFLFGIALYAIYKTNGLTKSRALGLFAVSAFLLVLPNEEIPRFIADGLPAAGVVWSACHIFRDTDVKLLRFLGDASYSIYLFHLAVLSLVYRASMSGLLHLDIMPMGFTVVALIFVATTAGILLHWVVERPLLRVMRKL